MYSRLSRALAALAVGTCALIGAPALGADGYPSKPIRMIVPYAAGGGLDAISRLVAQGMSEVLGQNIAVENRAGAGGTIGAETVARATPDGYTVLMSGNPELVIAPALYPETVRYDVLKDFVPIMLVSESPNLLFAHPSVTATLPEILSGKAGIEPSVGTPGQGSPQHIALEIINTRSAVKLVHVPYKGAGPALADVIGGHVKLGLVGAPPVLRNAKSGKVKLIAVTQSKRTPLAPDVPTVEELTGIKGLESFTTWYGLLVPAATPPAAVEALRKAITTVLARPEVQAKLAAMGTALVAAPTDVFAARIRDELKRYDEVVRRFDIRK